MKQTTYFVMRKIEGFDLFAAYYGPFTQVGALRVAKRLTSYMPVGTPEQWCVADLAGAKDHDSLGVHALMVKTY
jgi:hypothetical protein